MTYLNAETVRKINEAFGEETYNDVPPYEVTYEEIIAAGINVADPQNSHVYEADIHLFFTPDEPEPVVPLPIYITPGARASTRG